MFFDSIGDFFAMGGHGFYVWLSYGISFVLIAANFIMPVLKRKQLHRDMARLSRREQN
jgi:heme exporter protein D